MLKVQHKPIKRSKLGFKRKEQKKPKRTLVWRTGLSGAPGAIQSELFTFGFIRRHSAIIHRTVQCATRLSGVPPEQGLGSATVDSNGRLQCEQCADSSCRVRAAPEGAPDSEECLSGAPRCQSSNGRNRQNPNGWVTWLAHRTVSGGVRCAHRQTASSTVGFVVGAINTPNHHHSKHPSFSDISFNTRASAINTRHNSIESNPLQVPNPLQTNSD
jgi:hypothetical protein